MAFTVIQAGGDLQFVDAFGGLSPLPLPSGVVLRQDVQPRWTVYGRYVILVNTPTRPLTIDATGTVRPLTPLPPRLAAVLAGVAGGSLSGTYRVLYTNVIKDSVGNVISESDYSPGSNAATISAQALQASSLDISPDPVDARRLYRTTTNGAVFFQWIDLDGNVLTSVQDDLPDAGLGETAGPRLGTPPRLTLIAEFRDRLFGVGDIDIDSVVYTETGLMYAWHPQNAIAIPRVGSDTQGVTALAGRREALGVGRLNRLSQIVGTGEEDADGNADLRCIKLSDETGFLAQESVAVYRDVVYFLWFDGVYQWDDNGILCLSDGSGGHARVRSWFAKDDYFDRRKFPLAFAHVDPIRNKYRLFLDDPAGVKHYVEFDLTDRVWFGPHRVDAFRASSVFLRLSVNNVQIPTVGATDGGLYVETPRAADVSLAGQPFGIAYDVDTKAFMGTSPDRLQYFGELSILGKSQPAGTLTITPRVGYLDEDGGLQLTPQAPILHSLRRGREHLRRIGTGALAQLNLAHDGIDERVSTLGLEIADVHEVGRR
jgi:hypothetical protein